MPAAIDRGKRHFRTFLRADCGFLTEERDRRHARKREGAVGSVSIDAGDAVGLFRIEPGYELTSERHYDRDWPSSCRNGRTTRSLASMQNLAYKAIELSLDIVLRRL